MRIAVFSDVHACYPQLKLVLDDIARHHCDHMVCLGDVATLGDDYRPTMDCLQSLAGGDVPCEFVMGNHDHFLLDPAAVHTYTTATFVLDRVAHCRTLLTESDRAFVAGFKQQVQSDCGVSAGVFFHATPASNVGLLLPSMTDEQIRQALGDVRAPLLVCGHTHVQFLRQVGDMTIVNPGSVGMPFKDFPVDVAPTLLPMAQYAIVTCDGQGVEVTFRRLALA